MEEISENLASRSCVSRECSQRDQPAPWAVPTVKYELKYQGITCYSRCQTLGLYPPLICSPWPISLVVISPRTHRAHFSVTPGGTDSCIRHPDQPQSIIMRDEYLIFLDSCAFSSRDPRSVWRPLGSTATDCRCVSPYIFQDLSIPPPFHVKASQAPKLTVHSCADLLRSEFSVPIQICRVTSF